MPVITFDVREFPALDALAANKPVSLIISGRVVGRMVSSEKNEVMIAFEDIEADQPMSGRFERFMEIFQGMKDKDGSLRVTTQQSHQGMT